MQPRRLADSQRTNAVAIWLRSGQTSARHSAGQAFRSKNWMIYEPRKCRVYLVDDSPIIVRLLEGLLVNEPKIAIIGKAACASTATAEIAQLAPDVVVLDIALDNSTGFSVLGEFTPPRRKRPVFMVCTNLTLAPYRRRAARLGADFFFDKHSQIIEMLRTIVRLSRASPRRA
jgi:chemotaxis response regulator CheB